MNSLPLWLTAESPCGYFDDRSSQSLVADPQFPLDSSVYAQLLALGFRRSGNQVYRPHCANCAACVPTRIPVNLFRADRKQRRCAKYNLRTRVLIKDAKFDERHFELYRRYQIARHGKQDADDIDREDFLQFFLSDWCNTWFVEFLIEGHLAAIAVVDHFDRALSAVYTFFDPAFNRYSPGIYAVLWQIDEAKRRGMDYVYLGFWIADCRKMQYKIQYQPLSGLIGDQWQTLSTTQTNED